MTMASIDDIYARQIELSGQLGELTGSLRAFIENSHEERTEVRSRLAALEECSVQADGKIGELRDTMKKAAWTVAGGAAVITFLFTAGPALISAFHDSIRQGAP
jgi:hypothetical protein